MRGYKRLANVEQAFRSLKGLDLLVRPIHHRVDHWVKAHIFVCLLAYYVVWHLKQAWAPLLFADEHLAEHRAGRDPVAPARPPAEVTTKKAASQTDGGYEVQSFSSCSVIREEGRRTNSQLGYRDDLSPSAHRSCSGDSRRRTDFGTTQPGYSRM